MNNFDDVLIEDDLHDDLENEVPLPPPPPVYSEGDLAAAKKKAFDEGYEKGVKDTEASRSHALSNALQRLAQDAKQLIDAEKAREAIYEREVIALCHALFKKAFPLLQENYGYETFMKRLESILQTQQGQKSIEITTSIAYAQGVEAFIKKLSEKNTELRFSVKSDQTLDDGAFQIRWKDGGSIYDSKALATSILSNLEEMLAGEGFTSHNKDSEESNISDADTHQDFPETELSDGDISDDNPISGG